MVPTDFILLRALRLKLDLIPGPPHHDRALYNPAIQAIARYPAVEVATAIGAMRGITLVTDGSFDPRAWQWVWRADGDRRLRVGFTAMGSAIESPLDLAWGRQPARGRLPGRRPAHVLGPRPPDPPRHVAALRRPGVHAGRVRRPHPRGAGGDRHHRPTRRAGGRRGYRTGGTVTARRAATAAENAALVLVILGTLLATWWPAVYVSDWFQHNRWVRAHVLGDAPATPPAAIRPPVSGPAGGGRVHAHARP